jgi:hypothetical protein
MNVEPPETLVLIESIVYKSNGFAIVISNKCETNADDVKSRKIVNSEPKNGLQSRFEKKSSGLCGKWRGYNQTRRHV